MILKKNEPLHIHSTTYYKLASVSHCTYLGVSTVDRHPLLIHSHPLPFTPDIHALESPRILGVVFLSSAGVGRRKKKGIDLRTYIIDGIPCPAAALRSKYAPCPVLPGLASFQHCPPYPYIASNTPLTPFLLATVVFPTHIPSRFCFWPISTINPLRHSAPLALDGRGIYYLGTQYAVVLLKSPSQFPIPISHIHPGPIPTAYYPFILIHTHTYPSANPDHPRLGRRLMTPSCVGAVLINYLLSPSPPTALLLLRPPPSAFRLPPSRRSPRSWSSFCPFVPSSTPPPLQRRRSRRNVRHTAPTRTLSHAQNSFVHSGPGLLPSHLTLLTCAARASTSDCLCFFL